MEESNKPENKLLDRWVASLKQKISHLYKHLRTSKDNRGRLIFEVALLEVLIVYWIVQKVDFPPNQGPWKELLGSNGIWTFIVLLISAPIAFLVWKFRDENTVYQLENQRKDVNLKEFQKIAEWVSGLHLVEDKLVEKTKNIEKSTENNSLEQGGNQEKTTDTTLETETSREYGQAGTSRHIPSHSRQDGAVGLQVAAVYMLKPFYCGEHGDGFRRPALNLLTAAWLALFKQVEENIENQSCSQSLDSEELRNSPLAIALTEVLLADGAVHLRLYPEVFPNLYLPYLNLHLSSLNSAVLSLFSGNSLDCSAINLSHAQLNNAQLNKAKLNRATLNNINLQGANLSGAELNGTELNDANLKDANLSHAKLTYAKLRYANLNNANLNNANLATAELGFAELKEAKLNNSNLNHAQLNFADLRFAHFSDAKLNDAKLNMADLEKVMLGMANLSHVEFIGANLKGANLNGANLNGANLIMAQLDFITTNDQTNWRGVILNKTNAEKIFPELDVAQQTWLITVPDLEQALCAYQLAMFIFEREEHKYIYQLPAEWSIQFLQTMNLQWQIARQELD